MEACQRGGGVGVRLERGLTGQRFEQHDTECIEVGTRIDWIPVDLLGGQVGRRGDRRVRADGGT